jgi:hypothetical protein
VADDRAVLVRRMLRPRSYVATWEYAQQNAPGDESVNRIRKLISEREERDDRS